MSANACGEISLKTQLLPAFTHLDWPERRRHEDSGMVCGAGGVVGVRRCTGTACGSALVGGERRQGGKARCGERRHARSLGRHQPRRGKSPGPINPGGSASASAPNGGDTITVTGSGTFGAPRGNNGGSGSVTGGGAWRTSTGGSGTYVVRELVSFVFANFQAATPVFIDNIGNVNDQANGTAVLRIEYSDGEGFQNHVRVHAAAR